MKTGNEPAVPFFEEKEVIKKTYYEGVDGTAQELEKTEVEHVQHKGMSIRQQACLMAMQGMLTNPSLTEKHEFLGDIPKNAIRQADALLLLEKETR